MPWLLVAGTGLAQSCVSRPAPGLKNGSALHVSNATAEKHDCSPCLGVDRAGAVGVLEKSLGVGILEAFLKEVSCVEP